MNLYEVNHELLFTRNSSVCSPNAADFPTGIKLKLAVLLEGDEAVPDFITRSRKDGYLSGCTEEEAQAMRDGGLSVTSVKTVSLTTTLVKENATKEDEEALTTRIRDAKTAHREYAAK